MLALPPVARRVSDTEGRASIMNLIIYPVLSSCSKPRVAGRVHHAIHGHGQLSLTLTCELGMIQAMITSDFILTWRSREQRANSTPACEC
jgi:hypothetical protein